MSTHKIPDSYSLNIGIITKVVAQAFTDATNLLFNFHIKNDLDRKNITNMNQLNNFIQKVLRTRSNTMDFSELFEETDEVSDSENELDIILDSESDAESDDQQFDNEQSETSSVCSDGILHDVQGATFSGMRVFDTVRPELAKSYFQIEIDSKKKFIHKQTACWVLAENKAVLSNDRLTRVMQK